MLKKKFSSIVVSNGLVSEEYHVTFKRVYRENSDITLCRYCELSECWFFCTLFMNIEPENRKLHYVPIKVIKIAKEKVQD